MAEDSVRDAELPLELAGTRLRRAREGRGLSRADIASRTRIAERHLIAIEENRFADLASSTYAIGFSRAYARAVGLDEFAIARDVRAAIDESGDDNARPQSSNFEPGDPARIPAASTAWIAALAAVAVLGIVFLLWRSYLAPAADLPDLTRAPGAAASAPADRKAAAASPAPAAAGAAKAVGAVVFTAREEGIWVKFYDSSGAQLMQKQMALGERYQVPDDAEGPQIWTARPDALAISVGGKAVAPLAPSQMTIKDVPVSAAALLARGPEPAASGSPAPPARTP